MPATLAFYKGTRRENDHALIGDELICWWTRGRFSHLELIAPDGRGASSSMRDGGVRYKQGIDWASGRWELVTVDATPDWAYFESQIGKPYDYLGLVGFVLPFARQEPGRWYCSEIVLRTLGWASDRNPVEAFADAQALRLP